MLLNRTRALAETAMISALSVIFLLIGTFVSVNTVFFTALAAYLLGYSANKYDFRYSVIQFIACTLLDVLLNPDKLHWVLYLCLGGYILLSELVFQKWNRIEEIKKKMRMQLFYNWILFNVIYIPLIVFFENILIGGDLPEILQGNTILKWIVLWSVGQIGWFVYDKAYRVFFRTIRERKL